MNKKSKPEIIISRKIEIVGLITSVAFQNAKLCAQTLCKYHSKQFSKPKFRGMLEFDWDEHLMKQRRKFGGLYWTLLRPVAVYIDGQLIGSDLEFVEEVNYQFSCRIKVDNIRNGNSISRDYTRYLVQSKRCYVYLEIWIEKTRIGNLVFQLYSDLLPETCYNFRCLCTGEKGSTEKGVPLSYKNTEIFRICPMGWIQGGDMENISGGGGRSVYGATFADESYCISHERRGVLSMANDGKHSNGSQFFVTLQPTLWMDYFYVAFGQLVEGVEVLKAIEGVSTFYEKPTQHIKIANCGVLYAPETEAEKAERERMAAEKEAQRLYDIEARRISLLNEGTIIFPKTEDDNVDQKIKFVSPVDVLDPRDVPSELNVQRFLEGEYYVMDVPINTEDIIRPILNGLADGVINEEDLIVFTSNEQFARSIIMDCVANGIVSYDNYDVDRVTSSDISMIQSYLHAIISNMSTASSRRQKAEEKEALEKSSKAIKEYLDGLVTSLTGSALALEQKDKGDKTTKDQQADYNYQAKKVVIRDEEGDIIEEDNEPLENIENDELSIVEGTINMEGEGLDASHLPEVDGIEEMYGAAMDEELQGEDEELVRPFGSKIVQRKQADKEAVVEKVETANEVMVEISETDESEVQANVGVAEKVQEVKDTKENVEGTDKDEPAKSDNVEENESTAETKEAVEETASKGSSF